MSIFQCQKCGCAENTACTHCYHCVSLMNQDLVRERSVPALLSYKKILGLKPDEPFGKYCSACCPVWFDSKGEYGVGPNPNPRPDRYGRNGGGSCWHGEFERTFLPKGKFITNPQGNLAHKETGSTDLEKYKLEKEEGT